MVHVNKQIEIDWMLENYRSSKHYKDHLNAYAADKEERAAILDELWDRKDEWNRGTLAERRKSRDAIVKEIRGRNAE